MEKTGTVNIFMLLCLFMGYNCPAPVFIGFGTQSIVNWSITKNGACIMVNVDEIMFEVEEQLYKKRKAGEYDNVAFVNKKGEITISDTRIKNHFGISYCPLVRSGSSVRRNLIKWLRENNPEARIEA